MSYFCVAPNPIAGAARVGRGEVDGRRRGIGPTSRTVVGSVTSYTPADIRAIDDENISNQLKDVYASFPASKLVRARSLRSHVISYFVLPLQTLVPSALL